MKIRQRHRSVGVALKSDLLELQIHSDKMPAEEMAYILTKYNRRRSISD